MDLRNFSLICWGFFLRGRHLEALKAAFITGKWPRLDLHVVEGAPATVGVPRAQALLAGGVLLTGLHGHPGHLQGKHTPSSVLLGLQENTPSVLLDL